MLLAVTGVSTLDHLDLELQDKEGAGPVPGVRVAPAEDPAIADAEVGKLGGPHWMQQGRCDYGEMLRWRGNNYANQSLTNVSQVEIHCVGLQTRVAVYVQREGDTVLLFSVRTVGILTAHPRSVGVQLTWDLVLVPEVETDR